MNDIALPIEVDERGLTPQQRTRILHYYAKLIAFRRPQVERIHRDNCRFWLVQAAQSKAGSDLR